MLLLTGVFALEFLRVRLAVIIAMSILLGGCASLPPILQRWAGLDIATFSLMRDDSNVRESFLFSQDGLTEVGDTHRYVSWRVRGAWLEIDTNNDGTFQTRLRAITITPERIVAENPAGKKSVWRYTRAYVLGAMVKQKRRGVGFLRCLPKCQFDLAAWRVHMTYINCDVVGACSQRCGPLVAFLTTSCLRPPETGSSQLEKLPQA